MNQQSTLDLETLAQWTRKISEHKAAVSRERERLVESIHELEALRDCCDRACEHLESAYEDLESARAALSEFV